MRDPYTILGLPRTADKAEIKKAFRKLAKKYHPDQSKEPRAKERFAEANSAYEILGDDQKRSAFDRGEIDAEGKPRYQGFEGFGGGPGGGHYEFHDFGGASPFGRASRSSGGGAAGFDPSDFFSDLLNNASRGSRQQAARGEDVTASVSIPIEDVLTGASARVSLPTGRTLEVKVPAGMEDGKAIRLRGQGHAGQGGGPSGDAIVTVTYAPHKLFHVEKRDLKLDLPVTVYEAVLGGKINVPTLDGSVEITLPPGANRGRTLRLRGKGLPGAQGSGDLLVTPRIALPDKVDAEFEEVMRRWKAEKPYDPRAGRM